jgi:hypothetical protein
MGDPLVPSVARPLWQTPEQSHGMASSLLVKRRTMVQALWQDQEVTVGNAHQDQGVGRAQHVEADRPERTY